MHKLKGLINAWIVKQITKLMNVLPIGESVVFECESDMDDNPMAFYKFLIEKGINKKRKLIWIVNDTENSKRLYGEKNVKFVNRKSSKGIEIIKTQYYLNTAKYFIFSHPYWYRKKSKKQIVMYTGHGLPLKNRSIKDDKKVSETFDYYIAPSKNVIPWMIKFWLTTEDKAIICGAPRNDLLVSKKDSVFRNMFNISSDAKTIMCMPTYKQSRTRVDGDISDPYSISVIKTENDYNRLNEYLQKNNCVLLIKPHPLQKIDNLLLENKSNIHYLTNRILFDNKILLYELLGFCDALITDFSGVYFDFLLLNRPIGFLMNNFNKYTRGYIVENPQDYMPGIKIYNYEQLIQFLNNVRSGYDDYEEDRNELNRFINGDTYQHLGHYGEQLFDTLIKIDEEKKHGKKEK